MVMTTAPRPYGTRGWSEASRAKRMERAVHRRYVQPWKKDMTYIETPTDVAPRAKQAIHGLVATRDMEISTRVHRRNTSDLLKAVENQVSECDAVAFESVTKTANLAKHKSWIQAKAKPALPAVADDGSSGRVACVAPSMALVLKAEALEQDLLAKESELRELREHLKRCTEERDWLRQLLSCPRGQPPQAPSAAAEHGVQCDFSAMQDLKVDMASMQSEVGALKAQVLVLSADAEEKVEKLHAAEQKLEGKVDKVTCGLCDMTVAMDKQSKDTTILIRAVVNNLEQQMVDMAAKSGATSYLSLNNRLDDLAEALESLRFIDDVLRIGDAVWFSDLKSAADLNGSSGTIKLLDNGNGMYVVDAHKRGKDIRCKSANLLKGTWCSTCEQGIGSPTCLRCGRTPVPYKRADRGNTNSTSSTAFPTTLPSGEAYTSSSPAAAAAGEDIHGVTGKLNDLSPCPGVVRPPVDGGATRGGVEATWNADSDKDMGWNADNDKDMG